MLCGFKQFGRRTTRCFREPHAVQQKNNQLRAHATSSRLAPLSSDSSVSSAVNQFAVLVACEDGRRRPHGLRERQHLQELQFEHRGNRGNGGLPIGNAVLRVLRVLCGFKQFGRRTTRCFREPHAVQKKKTNLAPPRRHRSLHRRPPIPLFPLRKNAVPAVPRSPRSPRLRDQRRRLRSWCGS